VRRGVRACGKLGCMNLLPPRPRLRMSLRRQLRMLMSSDSLWDLTEQEWDVVQTDFEARVRWLGGLDRIFEIARRAAADIGEVLRT
jgi:hypothetical protein